MPYDLTCPLLARSSVLKEIARGGAPALRRGSSGDAVQRLQRALRITEGALCPLTASFAGDPLGPDRQPPDGDYGTETVDAVRKFQAKHFRAKPTWHTGLAGAETLHQLDLLLPQGLNEGAAAALAVAAAAPPPPAPAPEPAMRSTDADLQRLVRRVRQRVSELGPAATDYIAAAPMHVVLLPATIRMTIIQREDARRLTDTIDFCVGLLPHWKVVVNGSYGRRPYAVVPEPTDQYGLAGELAVDGRMVHPLRESFESPLLVGSAKYGAWHHSLTGAYLAYAPGNRSEAYRFGSGFLPGGAVMAGLSALTPVMLGDDPRSIDGPENPDYRDAVSLWGPLPRVCGRNLIGQLSASKRIVVIVQQDNGARYELDQLRLFARDIGCWRAVGLDGSDSVLLRIAGHRPHPAVVSNSRRKDNICATAVAFYE